MNKKHQSTEFDYDTAFQRNIGLLTQKEQERLRNFTVAIPGMGGAGGAHLIALVRQGFERFKIADLDMYELKNFNRQYGANMQTVGRDKIEVMKEEALSINPQCQIETFNKGINEDNLDKFFENVDLAVDGIDFFEVEIRRKFFNRALKLEIPVITAGPMGFSTAFLIFMPGGPNFDEYFAVKEDTSYTKKLASFAVGLAPKMLQRKYMRGVSLKEKRGPSSVGAINLCAGVVAIYALKVLLGKGTIKAVPYFHQFDVMRNKYVVKKMWWGNNNPIQRLKIKFAEKIFR